MRRLAAASALTVAWLVCAPGPVLATATDDAPADDEEAPTTVGGAAGDEADTGVGVAVAIERSPCGVLPDAPFDAILEAHGDDSTSGVVVTGIDRDPTPDDDVIAGVPMTVVADGGLLLAEVPVGSCEDEVEPEVEVGGEALDAEGPAPATPTTPATPTAPAAPATAAADQPQLAATGPTSTLLGFGLGQLLVGAGLVLRVGRREAEAIDG